MRRSTALLPSYYKEFRTPKQQQYCAGVSEMEAPTSRKGALYVHWPYCSQICSYCNFNKYRSDSRSLVESDKMFYSLVSELKAFLKKSCVTCFTSVYFGGGTPSLAGPQLVDTVLNALTKYSHLSDNAEVTLEANPVTINTGRLREFRSAGVSRLSLGIQSLNDTDLKLMNRDHSSIEGISALHNASVVFPGQVSIDIIFGKPGQTLPQWSKELDKVLSLADNHISLYQLTVERGTPLAKDVSKGKLLMPDEDSMADLYEHAIERLAELHYRRYEISNFAKQGFESCHNLSYWNGVDYLGIGPGAHSRFKSRFEPGKYIHCVNTLEPRQWADKVSQEGVGITLEKQLTKLNRLEEVVATCLRTTNGLTAEIFQEYSTISFGDLVKLFSHERAIEYLTDAGLLHLSSNSVKASSKGLNVLDTLLADVVFTVLNVERQLREIKEIEKKQFRVI